MRTRQLPRLALLVSLACLPAGPVVSAQPPTFNPPDTHQPTDAELDTIRAKTEELGGLLKQIRSREPLDPGHPGDEFADVAVFHKAAEWIVRHGEFYRPDYVGMTLEVPRHAAWSVPESFWTRKRPWRAEAGSHVLGYVSAVDGSVQPYAVIVPEVPENRSERMRLDVVLHGRNATLNEVRFIADHEGKPAGDEAKGLVLHVFGRGNNAYRWAGETDVFEAIAAVKRAYPGGRTADRPARVLDGRRRRLAPGPAPPGPLVRRRGGRRVHGHQEIHPAATTSPTIRRRPCTSTTRSTTP